MPQHRQGLSKATIILLSLGNLVLMAFLLGYIGTRGLQSPPQGWAWTDLITVLLACIGILLTVLTIFLAIAAVWGYTTIRAEAIKAAEKTAEERATKIASDVAVREARSVSPILTSPNADEQAAAFVQESQTT